MAELDWTAVIVAFIGGGGTLTTLVGIYLHKTRPTAPKETEDRAESRTHTPVSPGTGAHDVQAIRLAQQAMDQVSNLSAKLTATETRLNDVERELGIFRRSYNALYWWAQRILYDWDAVREEPNPPNLPDGIHHPET